MVFWKRKEIGNKLPQHHFVKLTTLPHVTSALSRAPAFSQNQPRTTTRLSSATEGRQKRGPPGTWGIQRCQLSIKFHAIPTSTQMNEYWVSHWLDRERKEIGEFDRWILNQTIPKTLNLYSILSQSCSVIPGTGIEIFCYFSCNANTCRRYGVNISPVELWIRWRERDHCLRAGHNITSKDQASLCWCF